MTTAAICASREFAWSPSFYRGEQYDPDLELYYLRARYYNPNTGRFMSRDPKDGKPIDPQSLHKYLYAGGDPVNRIDPRGREDEEEEEIVVTRQTITTLRVGRQMAYANCVLLAIAANELFYASWTPMWEADLLLADAIAAAKVNCSALLMGWPGW